METDKHFYEIFEVNPQWIFELTGPSDRALAQSYFGLLPR